MKLLRQSDIQTLKNEEAKAEIDQGISLARKIDQLRKTAVEEQKQLEAFRVQSTETIRAELDSYNELVRSRKAEIAQLELQRQELLKPLDEEWSKLYQFQIELDNEKRELGNEKSTLRHEQDKLVREKAYIEKVKTDRQIELDKAKEARLLAERNKRQTEGELANVQKLRSEETSKFDERLQKVTRYAEELLHQLTAQKEYKATLTRKEKELKVWEQRLLVRDYGELHRPKQ